MARLNQQSRRSVIRSFDWSGSEPIGKEENRATRGLPCSGCLNRKQLPVVWSIVGNDRFHPLVEFRESLDSEPARESSSRYPVSPVSPGSEFRNCVVIAFDVVLPKSFFNLNFKNNIFLETSCKS